jgi:hypothetical protein
VDHASRMFLSGAAFGDQDAVSVGDDVGIREEAVGANEKSRSCSASEAAGIPRSAIVGDLGGDFDANDGLVNFVSVLGWGGCILCQRERVKERNAAKEQQESIHGGKLSRIAGE